MNDLHPTPALPEILAPAGGRDAFLAAVAGGADAVYCGLKHFSARMKAENFTVDDLARLTEMAHRRGVRVYVAFNSLVRPSELQQAGRLLATLASSVGPDALIVQDLSLVPLARQAGFEGELHLSTLSNAGFPAGLQVIREGLGVQRVVIPRELSIDEIKQMAAGCPRGLSLEVFVHGALCYGVSGRCYWSSFLGGRSGLRGRCVQPCRRLYRQGDSVRRFFSCQDLSLDVLVKVLAEVPQVSAWKIEGRKKSAHYVYHTVKAYRLLRDQGSNPDNRADAKREAMELLSMSLGRSANHFRFLPQRPWHPVQTDIPTGSGLLIGKIRGASRSPYLTTREALQAGDLLRIGYEDDPHHRTLRIKRFVPARGRLQLDLSKGHQNVGETSVFLIDRRGGELAGTLSGLSRETDLLPARAVEVRPFVLRLPRRQSAGGVPDETTVYRLPRHAAGSARYGLWLSPDALSQTPARQVKSVWWWLPPVIWPDNQDLFVRLIADTRRKGGRFFVINAPWQAAFFGRKQHATLWAGPFCNLANPLAIEVAASLGAAGVVVSPELGQDDLLSLPAHSPLPLGIVTSGSWPLCISRILAEDAKTETRLASPRGEGSWVRQYGSDFWVYPDWRIDLSDKKKELTRAGYRFFVTLFESPPPGLKFKQRAGLWNWVVDLR